MKEGIPGRKEQNNIPRNRPQKEDYAWTDHNNKAQKLICSRDMNNRIQKSPQKVSLGNQNKPFQDFSKNPFQFLKVLTRSLKPLWL
jgi:hypothetical protein